MIGWVGRRAGMSTRAIFRGLLGFLFRAAHTLEARDAESRPNFEVAVVILDAKRPMKVRSVRLFGAK